MLCAECKTENPDNVNFCGQCGAQLKRVCSQCGAVNPAGFKFCGECGHVLSDQSQHAQSAVPAKENEKGERRQLTVMFCDMVGSTSLSQQLDPEDLRDVVRLFQNSCAHVIARYDGHIAKYMGDGLLINFGYPLAHEDDPLRAVRAGIAMLEAIAKLKVSKIPKGVSISARIGVHTGLVVVDEMGAEGHRQLDIIGETPNVAARLQALAEPGSMCISHATYRLTRGLINCHDLGPQTLKGISQPVECYRVLNESGARSRFQIGEAAQQMPLVGRLRELGVLQRGWLYALDGVRRVALIDGEAGIGKSRLIDALKEYVAVDPEAWLTQVKCSQYNQNSAFQPVIELLEHTVLDFERTDSELDKLHKIEGWVAQYGMEMKEGVPLLATLLSVPPGPGYPPLAMTPQRQKQRTMETLTQILLYRAANQPLLFIVEDLHWADASTIELISMIMNHEADARMFTVLTYRPEFQVPWDIADPISISLTRFPANEVEDLVLKITGGKPLPKEVLKQIIDKTDGVPLFVEELVKMVLESGLLRNLPDGYVLASKDPLPPLAIPTTLHDSLMARLDRLSNVKLVAQLGATIGRNFSFDLMRAVSPLNEETLKHELRQLVDAELLYQQGAPPNVSYVFKHALVQEEAYVSMLNSTRADYHLRIANALKEKFPAVAETQPDMLARHLAEGGNIAEAVPLLQAAGQHAMARFANIEAIGHFTRAMELLMLLPEGIERMQAELGLQMYLGQAQMFTKGYASPEAEHAFTRGKEICEAFGNVPQLFPVQWGLWAYYLVRSNMAKSFEQAAAMMASAVQLNDVGLLLESHSSTGTSHFWAGNFNDARTELEKSISLYDFELHSKHNLAYGQDPNVVSRAHLTLTLCILGCFDEALECQRELLAHAERLAFPYDKAYAYAFAAYHHMIRNEVDETIRLAEIAISISKEHQFLIWLADSLMYFGWAMANNKKIDEGIAQFREGVALYALTGAEVWSTQHLGLLGEMLAQNGRPDEGLSYVNECISKAQRNGELFFEDELHRLRGDILLLKNSKDKTAAEAQYRTALEHARSRNARLHELKAAVQLARLGVPDGRAVVKDIYARMTDGFEIPFAVEAKTFL